MPYKFQLLFAVFITAFSTASLANNHAYYPWSQPQYTQQNQSKGSGFGEWKNWMQNQLNGNSWQNGDGNIFQDAKGFYQLMGNGKTKWKFYFDVDFQMEMDAWLKGQGNSRANNRFNQNQHYNHNYQQYYNQQLYPNYYHGGQGQYQGYGYPQSGYYYPYQP